MASTPDFNDRMLSLGLARVSEAAALAVAGETSEIIVPRLISRGATCALAAAGPVA